ncbi:hypothetical protein [Sphingobium xanthum]|uniref:hypothetical protein n=2 Tax=Sphingobium TaxID=165695 RepID=UPI0015EC00B0|nr:hypothetical protein [Sphingobium xanthum]MCW2363752.1 hypothetical protein [Sphingobium sp. B10D3B]MCW2402850.1 hypothetical protein [Sphingobium sp. B10D7B]MCW2409828.1 hypothetical protein [Sphingobium xanthum]
MGQTRTMRAGLTWAAPDVTSLLARLFDRTSRAQASVQGQAAPSAWSPRPAPRRRMNDDLPATPDVAETAPTPRRPALMLVTETNALPAWASFSAVMPAPLSDLEVSALAAAQWPRARPISDDAAIRVASDATEEDSAAMQAALSEALARLRALTIQSRH